MKKFKLAILTCVVILSGCKTDINTTLPFSGFYSSGIKETKAELKVEIPACDDYKDSRKESSSLIDAKEAISKLFPSIEYVDCHKEKFESYATFSIPVNYGKYKDENWDSVKNISVIFNQTEQNISYIMLLVPDHIREAIDKNQNEQFSLNKIDIESLKINFKFENDTGKDLNINTQNVFVNNEAILYKDYTVKNNSNINVTLSNVAAHVAFNPKTDEYPFILNNIQPL